MIKWKSNKEYPHKTDYKLLVKSSKYHICDFMYYDFNENLKEQHLIKDNFIILWSEIDGWITYKEFLKDAAPKILDSQISYITKRENIKECE